MLVRSKQQNYKKRALLQVSLRSRGRTGFEVELGFFIGHIGSLYPRHQPRMSHITTLFLLPAFLQLDEQAKEASCSPLFAHTPERKQYEQDQQVWLHAHTAACSKLCCKRSGGAACSAQPFQVMHQP